ncbi:MULTISPECIES: M23 family metallopeptidase [unclassified Streptomyces]|uniref:M23 family metallopeptidase n=1 Tax=unclassified Streptomyces TaxID=2593676 RepID=UPI000DDC15B1|nr:MULTISPECIES: M23 family metallopeptidase [unclassified Streptomyces]QZZ29403.1 M23 family metallopeptidase [Streptomyces sp. ST1015]
MSPRALLRSLRTSPLRTRVAAGATAVGAAAVLGTAGTAFAASATWVDPVKSYTLTASYAQSGNLWSAKHSGQDFAVPTGTAVVAAHSGTVVKAGPGGAGDGSAYGNAIVIRHSSGVYSQYAHLSRVGVKVGQKVSTGQKIGLSGSTGNSTGPHLHFEIRTTANYGSAVNPVAFLRAKGVTV